LTFESNAIPVKVFALDHGYSGSMVDMSENETSWSR
jgi:hypothetical protein